MINLPMNRKSRPSTKLFRSVVTRLFSFPTKCPLLDSEDFASSATGAVEASEGACDFRLEALLAAVPSLMAVCVSSSVIGDSAPSLRSAIEALSGVVATLDTVLCDGVELVSALTLIRRAWLKTS